MTSIRLNVPLLILTFVAMAGLLVAGLHLTEIDTDITRFLPEEERVFSDALEIFEHHPIQSEMAIDLGVEKPDQDRLVACALLVSQRLKESGLFARVGTDHMQAAIPDLIQHLTGQLPVLFSEAALSDQVLPMLTPEAIDTQLSALHKQLLGMDAFGQAQLMAKDPLGLRNLVLARMAHMAPSENIEFYKGQIVSRDKQHLLLVAAPAQAGTDTVFARRIDGLMVQLSEELAESFGGSNPVTLIPMGAYRAALDNERIVRRDVQQAIILATIGIALLLLLTFPRPLMGLFAFLPAIGGTLAAFFVLALVHRSISIMALGFGGAIISITVDHGIAYLLFLDRRETSYGKAASAEIWAIGLIAALTTVGAFSALMLTGFPVFQQLGQFAALGIAFSFLFVHLVFPKIFPELPPARPRRLPLRKWVVGLPAAGKGTALAAVLFALFMLFWANPEFDTRLSAMNTVHPETSAAERLMNRVWGAGLLSKIYLMTEAPTLEDLQGRGDALLDQMDQDVAAGRLASGFVPAMVFPGDRRRSENWVAWQNFWTDRRVKEIEAALTRGVALGFSENAFAPFMQMVRSKALAAEFAIPEKYHGLMGITKRPDGSWTQFATLKAGANHDADHLRMHYQSMARIFDPGLFSETMGRVLFSTFTKMLMIIGGAVALLLLCFFRSWRLALIALAPVVFSLIATLGTLKLIGRPLDIPALMLAIVVFGMGIDYALFFVRAYERYGGMSHPDFQRIKMAVVMAAASTLIGFGVLCGAEHSLLRSAGLTSLLGIGYALLGAFLLLPPLLKYHSNRKGGTSPTR